MDKAKLMERELEQLWASWRRAGSDPLSQVIEIMGQKVLVAALEGRSKSCAACWTS